MDYKIRFECEQLQDGKWSVIGIDSFQMEDQDKKPSKSEIDIEVNEILNTWNQTAKPSRGEYPRRLKRIVSVEEIKVKPYKYVCDNCGNMFDDPDPDDNDEDVCPSCESDDIRNI